jgi:hypothetical protein
MADTTPPTIRISSNRTTLKAGETAQLTFSLSEPSIDFVLADIAISGGSLSNFTGSGANYTATFTPTSNSEISGSVSVGSFRFSDASGNANEDGADADNRVSFIIDTLAPTISISASRTFLDFNETPTLTFSLSEPSLNFDISDISVTGGTLSSFKGSGKNYSVIFTPNSTFDGQVSIGSFAFSDISGNYNNTSSNIIKFIPYEPSSMNVKWVRLLGTSSNDFSRSIATGLDGSIYVSGETGGNLDGHTNVGSFDSFVTKYNANGTKLWTRLIGSSQQDYAKALATGPDGSIYVSGVTIPSLGAQYTSGGFVTKFHADGTIIWSSLLNTEVYAQALTTGLDGSIYVSGFAAKNLDGQLNAGSLDSFITKYNANGAKLWTRLVGSSKDDYSFALTTGLDGSIYLAGVSTGTINGQSTSGGIVTKVNPDGTVLWTRILGTSVTAYALTTGLDGSIYVSGTAYSDLDGQNNSGYNDCFVIKFNQDGNKVWTRLFGTVGNDYSRSLTIGLDGSIYVSSYAAINLDGQTNNGSFDSFVTKFSPDGTRLFTRRLGTNSSPDDINALATGLDGSIYVSGFTANSLDDQNNSGSYDAFLIKFELSDTSTPTIAIISEKSLLSIGESANISLTLSKPSANFVQSDIAVQGGILSNFKGSGTTYTAIFTALVIDATNIYVSVESGKFSDALGIFNEDGLDANNKAIFAVNAITPGINEIGTNENDQFNLKNANEMIDGGEGIDTVTLSRTSNNYQLIISDKALIVRDKTGIDGTDILKNIERLQFTDRSVIVESKSHGSYADLPVGLYQFFITAFNAAPGVTYMDQLAEAYRYGLSVKQIVDIFATKSQFTDVYPSSMTNAQLAQALVNNIVKTSASDATKQQAVKDITDAMTLASWTVGQVIFQVFGNLANFAYSDPMWGNTAKQFANQIEVAKIYTDTLSQSTTDLATLRSVMAPVSHLSDVSTPELQITLIGQALMG